MFCPAGGVLVRNRTIRFGRLSLSLALPIIVATAASAPPASPQPAAAATKSPLLPPLEGQIADEYLEIEAILDYHHRVQRLGGRDYGLPEDDFDDATNITLRQRRWFRN